VSQMPVGLFNDVGLHCASFELVDQTSGERDFLIY